MEINHWLEYPSRLHIHEKATYKNYSVNPQNCAFPLFCPIISFCWLVNVNRTIIMQIMFVSIYKK